MDKKKFAIEMGKTAIKTQSEVDDSMMAVYWEEFSEWDFESFATAMNACCNELDKFPTPRRIREHCPTDSQLTGEARTMAAWAVVSRTLGGPSIGHVRALDFDDSIINATIRNLGGLHRIKQTSESDFANWYRREFLALYREYLKYPPNDGLRRALIVNTAASVVLVRCDYIDAPKKRIESTDYLSEVVLELVGKLRIAQ